VKLLPFVVSRISTLKTKRQKEEYFNGIIIGVSVENNVCRSSWYRRHGC